MNAPRWLSALVSCVIAAGGLGCGGDGEPDPVPPTIQQVQPWRVVRTINVGDRFPSTPFSISVTGDVAQLNGRTLYLLVEVPPGIIEGEPSLTIVGQTAQIWLTGAPQGAVGTLTGELVFHACLDPQCTTELAGSPTRASYAVTVGPGLVVDTPDLVEIDAVFGDNPSPLEVPVTLPVGSLGLQVTFTCRNDIADAAYSDDFSCPGPFLSETTTGTSPVIRLDPRVYYPGTYTATVHVEARHDVGEGARVSTRDFTVRYTVDGASGPALVLWHRPGPAEPVRYFAPEEGFAFDVGSTLIHEVRFGGYPRQGVLLWGSVDYSLSVPPAGADLQAPYSSWFSTYSKYASACHEIGAVTHCMEPGSYGATLDARVDAGGTSTHFAVPVTMTVLPFQ